MIDYCINHYDKVLTYLLEHVRLVFLSFLIAVIIAIPIGLFLSRKKSLQFPVVGFFNIVYAIPSLVLYTMLIPITGLGAASAIIALVLYSQFSLVKNICEGFRGVDPAVLEAGRGMGIDKFSMLMKVELPLALPVILSGMRLALSSITPMAILATSIGGGGLGTLIFDGLRTNNWSKIFLGTILSALLTVIINVIFQQLEQKARLRATGESTP